MTSPGWHEATVGSELAGYLRILQLAGRSQPYPWSVRGFSPREVDRLAPRDTLHPWARHLGRTGPPRYLSPRVSFLRPEARIIYNTTFPWAHGDGVAWAGVGPTTVARAGVQARFGPLSLTLAPIAFQAENDAFVLMDNGQDGDRRFASALSTEIDLPQRFGDRPYARLDPGQSTVRLDLPLVAAGISTATQVWGPGLSQPLVLGDAGPGFPHVFIGTSVPLNLWIVRVHGRLMVGRLEQSAYSPTPADSGDRLAAGFVATVSPRWTPGLEIGVTRFYHQRWPAVGARLDDLLLPFQGLFLSDAYWLRKYDPSSPDYTPENQLASVFARWVFPRSGGEVFGEFLRDDRNHDTRDLIAEPDQQSAFVVGFQKLLRCAPTSYAVLRGELVSNRITYLGLLRIQPRLYTHTALYQGHTHRGIALGSAFAAVGGTGGTIALDVYRPDGRWTVEGTRVARHAVADPYGVPLSRADAAYALRAERLVFRGGWEFLAAATAILDLQRNFRDDGFSLRLDLGTRLALRGSP